MLKWLLIAAGGACGSLLRYLMQGWVQRVAGGWTERLACETFPVGTLAVNTLGCLAIGLLSGFFAGPHLVREEYRVGLTIGILGGFTTFSTFGLESFQLANDGELRLALANVLLSCGIGFAAVWFGYRIAERWFGV
jgi:CrcB protein